MKRGTNTNNTLKELKEIQSWMKTGTFDFDGRRADIALQEVEDDIEELENK